MERVREAKEKARVSPSRSPRPPHLPRKGKVKVRVRHLAKNRQPKQCVIYASPAGCIRGKSCPFLHQNDSVTKKPLPADPADVQRLKGKLQSVPKPANSAGTVTTPAGPASFSGATTSTTPAPVLQLNMLRVDRQHLEPEPEPIRRHPVAAWRPHDGPTQGETSKVPPIHARTGGVC